MAALFFGAVALHTPPPAAAWGTEGHEVVALVAQARLSPAARRGVEELLAVEPGATLASISTWADRDRQPGTASWHYVNLPREAGCRYVAARDCADAACAIGALEAQVARLASQAPRRERFEALKYVVHLVGDLHQPLHAGDAGDRGGNTYQVQAFGRGSNLHAVWDTLLVRRLEPDAQRLAAALGSENARSGPAVALGADPEAARSAGLAAARWAAESCRLVAAPGFYPDRHVSSTYVDTYAPVLRDRLRAAGARLARTLEQVYAKAPS